MARSCWSVRRKRSLLALWLEMVASLVAGTTAPGGAAGVKAGCPHCHERRNAAVSDDRATYR